MKSKRAAGAGILTTGDVARICGVAPRTVAKWFNAGKLRGYRIPGSADRRYRVADVEEFMRAHGMLLPTETLDGAHRALLVYLDDEAARQVQRWIGPGIAVVRADTAFAAGCLAAQGVSLVVIDTAIGRVESDLIASGVAPTSVVAFGPIEISGPNVHYIGPEPTFDGSLPPMIPLVAPAVQRQHTETAS